MMHNGPKVLYVGVYRDGTGWSHSAIDYILALDKAGVQVACRPLKLNKRTGEIPARLLELERRRFSEYDAVIQHLLPHHMSFDGDCGLNTGLFFAETSHFRKTGWADHLNVMDNTWVCCEHNRRAAIDSSVTVPIHVLPIPCDTSRYERAYEPLSVRKELGDNFIFYTMGEFQRRKNLRALLWAFHTEFDVGEPVNLLVKVTPKGDEHPYDCRAGVTSYIDEVKKGMKLYERVDQYKPEMVLAGHFTEEEILRLHSSCDCGVFPSYAEAWGMASFDSMAMGKTPIVTGWGGFIDYMSNDCGWVVPYHLEPAFATQMDTFADLHTSDEWWAAVDIAALRAAMREAYEDRNLKQEKAEAGQGRAYDFGYGKMGRRMREVLSA